MKIALGQLECKLGDVEANVAKMTAIVAESASAAADLVVFPETSDTGYHMPTIQRLAGDAGGPPRRKLAEAAKRSRVNVIAGLTLREGGKTYNTAVVFDRSGHIAGEYRKIHLFGGERSREHDVFSAGDQPLVLPIDGVPTGIMICYDLRFPEIARSLMLGGAHLLVNVAAWPAVRIAHWRALAAARAIENLCAIVAVNRAGVDEGTQMGGSSCAFTQTGETLAMLGAAAETAIIEVNAKEIAADRGRFAWLTDRRPECYRTS